MQRVKLFYKAKIQRQNNFNSTLLLDTEQLEKKSLLNRGGNWFLSAFKYHHCCTWRNENTACKSQGHSNIESSQGAQGSFSMEMLWQVRHGTSSPFAIDTKPRQPSSIPMPSSCISRQHISSNRRTQHLPQKFVKLWKIGSSSAWDHISYATSFIWEQKALHALFLNCHYVLLRGKRSGGIRKKADKWAGNLGLSSWDWKWKNPTAFTIKPIFQAKYDSNQLCFSNSGKGISSNCFMVVSLGKTEDTQHCSWSYQWCWASSSKKIPANITIHKPLLCFIHNISK